MGIPKVFLHTVVMFYFISYVKPVYGYNSEDKSTTPFSTNSDVIAPAGNYKYHTDKLSTNSYHLECPMAPDCKTWFEYGVKTSGVYPINPDRKTPFQVIIVHYSS